MHGPLRTFAVTRIALFVLLRCPNQIQIQIQTCHTVTSKKIYSKQKNIPLCRIASGIVLFSGDGIVKKNSQSMSIPSHSSELCVFEFGLCSIRRVAVPISRRSFIASLKAAICQCQWQWRNYGKHNA